MHVGGGRWKNGVYLDTHTDPVVPEVLALVEELCARTTPPGVLLERDDEFPPPHRLTSELNSIAAAINAGTQRHLLAHDG